MQQRTIWTDELIRSGILSSMKTLMIERMPTAPELNRIGRGDLHNKISRTKKYKGWASELGLSLARGETRTGNEYESKVAELLEAKGFHVDRMSTIHPYDLKIDGGVKVDVKAANLYKSKQNTEWWTFHLAKEDATCDIYICVALGDGEIEDRIFVIPSHFLQMKSLNIGKKTKYAKFQNQFQIISEYSDFKRNIDFRYSGHSKIAN